MVRIVTSLLCWALTSLSCEARDGGDYHRTPKEKVVQIGLYIPRYLKLVLLDDFGIRESVHLADDYDHIGFH